MQRNLKVCHLESLLDLDLCDLEQSGNPAICHPGPSSGTVMELSCMGAVQRDSHWPHVVTGHLKWDQGSQGTESLNFRLHFIVSWCWGHHIGQCRLGHNQVVPALVEEKPQPHHVPHTSCPTRLIILKYHFKS